ncbi:hypothetical protein M9458_054731, partial [Cirrhinus mrigala]
RSVHFIFIAAHSFFPVVTYFLLKQEVGTHQSARPAEGHVALIWKLRSCARAKRRRVAV